MSDPRVDRIVRQQRPGGAFESFVTTRIGEASDENAFTTASVLRALRDVHDRALEATRDRALRFLESCGAASVPGAYGFWPEHARPAWGTRVPPDVDDTALVMIELLRHGRLTRGAALRVLCLLLLPCRVSPREGRVLPPWVVPGCFETWIPVPGAARGVQVVDACANANVAALMARLGATHLPGYREACATIDAGLAWAGDDARRFASLTPFYPSVYAFAEALEHARECGAGDLAGAASRVAMLARTRPYAGGPCCSSAYGRATWRCPALDDARALANGARA